MALFEHLQKSIRMNGPPTLHPCRLRHSTVTHRMHRADSGIGGGQHPSTRHEQNVEDHGRVVLDCADTPYGARDIQRYYSRSPKLSSYLPLYSTRMLEYSLLANILGCN